MTHYRTVRDDERTNGLPMNALPLFVSINVQEEPEWVVPVEGLINRDQIDYEAAKQALNEDDKWLTTPSIIECDPDHLVRIVIAGALQKVCDIHDCCFHRIGAEYEVHLEVCCICRSFDLNRTATRKALSYLAEDGHSDEEIDMIVDDVFAAIGKDKT